LRLGAWVAQGERAGGPDRAIIEGLDAYGRCFGLAFQITDDLLDVESSADLAGKRVGKDAARGKLTYPRLWGADESRRRAQQLCQEACGHLQPLGRAAGRLAALVTMILDRNR
jgi:geranylgeranyl diphosphate synthase type II